MLVVEVIRVESLFLLWGFWFGEEMFGAMRCVCFFR